MFLMKRETKSNIKFGLILLGIFLFYIGIPLIVLKFCGVFLAFLVFAALVVGTVIFTS